MKRLGILVIAIGFIACQSEKKNKNADSTLVGTPAVLTFKYDSVRVASKHIAAEKDNGKDTTTAIIAYPVFSDPELNKVIEQKTLKTSGAYTSINANGQSLANAPKSYQALAADFIKNYDQFMATEKENDWRWYLKSGTKVLRSEPDYLGLEHRDESFEGGAHPNSMLTYWNYNPKTKKEITIDSLIKPGTKAQLNAIAEKIFRKNEKLSPTASLKDNYFFDKDKFSLNDNFTITKEGLKFIYNAYEIKAYAYGRTELLIPFSELKAIAKPNSPISPLK